MTLGTTADSSGVAGGVGATVSMTVAAAERLLSRRFGATVRLDEPEVLGGGAQSTVVRVRVAASPFALPRTLVVKSHPPAGADAFVREAVSYQLFTALAPDERMCPEMFAHDGAERLVVLEDLGRGPTLADKLLGGDPRAAERSLLSWARSMGQLHAGIAGREADFSALIRRFGVPKLVDPLADASRAVPAELPHLLSAGLGVTTSAAVRTRAAEIMRRVYSAGHRSFSPSDACPDNNLITSRGVRFLDFKGGCWRDVLLDAGYLRVPFPSCWCSFSLPAGMAEAMIAAWRAEVREMWPDLDDDAVLLPSLRDAQLFWVWTSTCELLPRSGQSDQPIDPTTPSPSRTVALRARWRQLAVDAERVGDELIGEHARAVVAALESRFPPEDLLPYPAFR
ncbi:MAG TPA: hypothetical protein VG317_02945 [Pseudonocardiaceae bacterium]|nr:hypothetical protein [Pseudonocardiaceae bacterium]